LPQNCTFSDAVWKRIDGILVIEITKGQKMFLNENKIENAYMRDYIDDNGNREKVLVVQTATENSLISKEIDYLNSIANQGSMDFDRVQVVTKTIRNNRI
jgi:hypothetical protein